MNEEETAPPAQENDPGSTGPHGGIAPEIASTVGSILDAVEREAIRLREESRAEAERYLEQSRLLADELVEERRRRIAELSDELIAKSEAVVRRLEDAAPVRHGFDNLVRALAGAAERLARERDDAASDFRPPPFHGSAGASPPEPMPPSPYPPPPAPPVPAPLSYPTQPSHPPGGHEQSPEPPQPEPPQPAAPDRGDPRAVAAQMANAGATRRATREHLQQTFGKSFYSEVLDEFFGVGTDDDARAQRSRRNS